jgi:hypothetical protein
LILNALDYADATKYITQNRVENFDAITTTSLSDTTNGLNFRATPIGVQILLFSHSLGRKATLASLVFML